MFERENPDDYKCEGCHYFKKQFLETELKIDGVMRMVVIWFPSCRYYLTGGRKGIFYLTLFVATDRCKKFKPEEKFGNKGRDNARSVELRREP